MWLCLWADSLDDHWLNSCRVADRKRSKFSSVAPLLCLPQGSLLSRPCFNVSSFLMSGIGQTRFEASLSFRIISHGRHGSFQRENASPAVLEPFLSILIMVRLESLSGSLNGPSLSLLASKQGLFSTAVSQRHRSSLSTSVRHSDLNR